MPAQAKTSDTDSEKGFKMLASSAEKTRVLVVEDEEEIRELVALHLRREGHTVETAGSVEEAQALLDSGKFGLLALDWMLPGMSGVEMTRRIRKQSSPDEVAILMVTARAESNDIVEGLEAGADDYLSKPFEPQVLIARVRALLRRGRRLKDGGKPTLGEVIRMGGLELDPNSFEAKCEGAPVQLTASEFKLLLALANNRGRVLTRDSLIGLVQGEGVSVVGRTVDTHVFGLRKKLGTCADVIETVRGVGYRVKPDHSEISE